jgi:hypothetical protein
MKISNPEVLNLKTAIIIACIYSLFSLDNVLSNRSGGLYATFIAAIWLYPKSRHTANEGPVRIQYKCLAPIYVFPEMKLRSFVISKTEL